MHVSCTYEERWASKRERERERERENAKLHHQDMPYKDQYIIQYGQMMDILIYIS